MAQIELKDYLHYYIGADVQVKRKNDTKYHTGKIVEITRGSNHGDWIIVRFDDVITCTSNTWDTSTSNQHYFFLCEDSIKPILRRLSDIMDDELMEVCKLATSLPFQSLNFRINKFCISKERLEKYSCIDCSITGNVYSYVFDVSDGSVTSYTDDEISPTLDSQLIFHYLLIHHFDLFGLIDAGLAIDKASLNQ